MKRHIALLTLLMVCATAAARTTYPLNEGWRFFFKSETSSDNARIVTLPHTWDGETSGSNGGYLQTAATYQNDLFIPAEWSDKRLFLKFYGVQNIADLFVNGRHAGEHRGGATAFTFEITNKVKFSSENSIRVDVSNTWQNDVLPTSTDMNLYGGIYRSVELIVTDKTAISPLYLGSDGILIHPADVTPAHAAGEAEVHLTSTSTGSACAVTLDIAAPDGSQVFTRTQKARLDGKPVSIPFTVDNPALWSPATPQLYTVTVRIEADNGRDTVSIRTGFRDIRVTPEGGFCLNGECIRIKGVALGHDNISAGNALTDDDYRTDLTFVREMGANAVRSAGMPHGQALYGQCDTNGMMAWVDLPFQRAPFFGDIGYFSTPRFEENGRLQLREMIAQLTNHPSVVMWGIFSCQWTRGDDVLPYIRSLNDIAHTMDPSRPTIACSDQDGEINFVTDLIVWQQSVGWDKGTTDDVKVWSDLMRKNWSSLRSAVCYGAEGIPGHRNLDAQPAPRANWLPESRQTRFHEGYARYLDNDSLFWGVWINNLFDFGSARRPYGINASGLVTIDRRTIKDAYYLYRALWNKRDSTLHITDKRRVLRGSELQQFKIYAQQQPTLLVNGDTIRVREWAPCQYLSDSVLLSGKCRIEASAGTRSDQTEIIAGSALKQRPQQAPPRKGGLQLTN